MMYWGAECTLSSENSAHPVEIGDLVIGALSFGPLFLATVELGWVVFENRLLLSGRAKTPLLAK
jgi:hypothetical protein